MSERYEAFRRAAWDPRLRAALEKSTSTSIAKRAAMIEALGDFEVLREKASRVRDHAVQHLNTLVETFRKNAEAAGAQVHFAPTAETARRIILNLLRRHSVREVVKSKSMTTEEIRLNEALETEGIRVTETDLGEFIVQLAGEPPSHITAPALHKSQEEIAALFREKLGYSGDGSAEDLTVFARRVLRERFYRAQAGISGANIAVAETGSLFIVENEGNARFTTTLPPVHIALVGIEKVVARMEDAGHILRVLAPSATGQKQSVYVSVITGPRRPEEPDGPEVLHIVLYDGGRRRIAQDPEMWSILKCIRCGACSTACPVYQVSGGHAYGSVYSGPLGVVLTPLLRPDRGSQELPFFSTLCGECAQVCPVKIPLPDLILKLRQRNPYPSPVLPLWRFLTGSPTLYRLAAALYPLFRRLSPLARLTPLRGWTRWRTLLPLQGFRAGFGRKKPWT